MAAISNQSSYSWMTQWGKLSLSEEASQLKLNLQKRDTQQIVDLSQYLPDLSTLHYSKSELDQMHREYIPVIKKDEKTGSFSVSFHEAAVPQNLVNHAFNVGFAFADLETEHYLEFSKEAPSYRKVIKGLNLTGICEEQVCTAFQQRVYIPRGMGKFDIGQEITEAACPECGEELKHQSITNLGFWDCRYVIKGVNERGSVNTENTAPLNKYKTFVDEDECRWTYLHIETNALASVENKEQRICSIL